MKKNLNVYFIVGLIFSLIGGLFAVIGIVSAMNLSYLKENGTGDVEIIPIVFSFIGFTFLILGIVFLAQNAKKNKIRKKLLEDGNYIMAEYTTTNINTSIRVNGRHPYVVECQYYDQFANAYHVFKSDNIFYSPTIPEGMQIKVYVDRDNFDNYYVDLESVLGTVHLH